MVEKRNGIWHRRPIHMQSCCGFAFILIAFLISLWGGTPPTYGQSLFTNGGNDGSIDLGESGAHVELTTKDIAKLSYMSQRQREHNASRVGLEVHAKPGGDVAPLFSSRKFAKGAGATLTLGQSYLAARLQPVYEDLWLAYFIVSDELGVGRFQKKDGHEDQGAYSREQLQAEIDKAPSNSSRRAALKTQLDARDKWKATFQSQQPPFLDEKILGGKTIVQLLDEGTRGFSLEERKRALYNLDPSARHGRALYYDQLDARFSYDHTTYSILDTSAASPAGQLRSEGFNGWSALLAYNAEFKTYKAWNFVFGIAGAYARTNNADDLKKVQVQDTLFTSPTGSPARQAFSTKDALVGPLKTSNTSVLALDFVVFPGPLNQRVAVSAFYRTRGLGVDPQTKVSRGLGVFLTQAGAPRKVIGGLILTWEGDDKPRVDLSVGFNFGTK